MAGRLASPAVVAAFALLPATTARTSGDDTVPATIVGRANFRSYCATCHGTDAKGDGPMADSLRVRPSDLTLIARRNDGRFPTDTVRRTIDGRSPVKGHGGPEMPVWGDAFRSPSEGYSEAKVAERIDALVEYLKSIQAR